MSRGILGLVLVIAILGVVAGLAVTDLSNSAPVLPSRSGTTIASSASPSEPAASPEPGSGALASACNADAQSVETAVSAYEAAYGTPPPNLAALVPTWLRSAPGTTHYTIAVDSQGHVGIFPAHVEPSGAIPSAARYDLDPSLCSTVPR